MSILDKVEIGNLVQVNLKLSKDRLKKETIEAINISSKCTVSDFKITDGMGLGVILKLANGKKEWFFENEIEILDETGNVKERVNNKNINNDLTIKFLKNFNYTPKIKFGELINPFNFITWLIVSFKDII